MLDRSLRVLICDDSALVRQFLAHALEGVPGIEVCGRATDGEEAVRLTRLLRPDVVTMDVEMPRLDGISAVRRIMTESPTPILMVSSLTTEGSRTTMAALEAGALDFIAKPQGRGDLHQIGPLVAEKILQLGERGGLVLAAGPAFAASPARGRIAPPALGTPPLVVIGSSTGGPRALFSVVPYLPAGFLARVIIVQHMPPGFTRSLAERLHEAGPLPVKEAEDGEPLHPGTVRVAAAGHHLQVDGHVLRYADTAPEHGVRPALDVTLRSAAQSYRGPIVVAVLTGMGRDGALGAQEVREHGGKVIAESERTALIYGMPKAVVDLGAADSVQDLPDVAGEIVRLCAELSNAH
ncbi:MAG: chemotaxis response regulator protein-glutamate methylesterase [Thermaerobacter sp.]|nr:chemotaxis response regulator protein-glutamate methylesterase [Thermaerobacter sp.]